MKDEVHVYAATRENLTKGEKNPDKFAWKERRDEVEVCIHQQRGKMTRKTKKIHIRR